MGFSLGWWTHAEKWESWTLKPPLCCFSWSSDGFVQRGCSRIGELDNRFFQVNDIHNKENCLPVISSFLIWPPLYPQKVHAVVRTFVAHHHGKIQKGYFLKWPSIVGYSVLTHPLRIIKIYRKWPERKIHHLSWIGKHHGKPTVFL